MKSNRSFTSLLPCLFTIILGAGAWGQSPVQAEQGALIPKRETGVLDFLKKHPEFDGRGVILAVFDTGVDPGAAGLLKTSTGERKIVDVIDATGSGDVDTSTVVEAAKGGTLSGLTGRTLTLPPKLKNPTGKFHLGMKRAFDLFNEEATPRIARLRAEKWQRKLAVIRDQRAAYQEAAEKKGERVAFHKAPVDLTLREQDKIAREELRQSLEKNYTSSDPGPVYDCVVWSDGKHFRVLVDTDEDGDLRDEKILRPFGIAGEYGSLRGEEAANFAVQVYEDGNLLSLVTVSGSHGSHVASIATAHFPDAPHRDGVAPGARVLSIKIGDIRLGGSSSGHGEMRGVAACAQYGVDLMNASWGGASQYQDGKNAWAEIYNRLAEDYGVTGFVSAGNSGPALSTLGSPGGEASSIIGVGAYVSSDMARVLYSQTTKAPSTSYQFSARGPAKNGDLGVDITGPGGAYASLSYEDLRKSQRYNGTSMSSPSVAGLGALLVSAAKQSKVPYSPARIRSALMNSARFLKGVEVFAQGAGLVQALPAWQHLQANAKQKAWDHFYTVETRANTFSSGPGLYLRGDIPTGKREVSFRFTPKFGAKVTAVEKYNLEKDLVFTATQPWVQIPDYARLANGSISIRPILNIPAGTPGVPIYAEIHAHLANSPKAGPLVRIPITILRGEKTDPHTKHHSRFELGLESGKTHRRFLQVPANANLLKVRVRRHSSDELPRLLMLHAVTLVADDSYQAYNSLEYLQLDPEGEAEVIVPVAAGKTTELAFHQPYFSVGKTKLEVEVQFIGLGSSQDLLVFHENENHIPLQVVSASDEEVQGEGKIDRAHFSHLPIKTEFLSSDQRDLYPPGPRQEAAIKPLFLRQTFSVTLKKPAKIHLSTGRSYSAGSQISDGMFTIYHESGKLIYQGGTRHRSGIQLPKGKLTISRDFYSLDQTLLEREKDCPFTYSMKLEKPKTLSLFQSHREVMRGAKAGKISLTKNRNHSLMVGASGLSSLAKFEPTPHYLSGRFTLRQSKGEKTQLLSIPVECRPGEDFGKTANQKKKPDSLVVKKSPVEEFQEELFQKRLGFVKAHKQSDKKALKAKRDEILTGLLKEKPKRVALLILKAEILATESGHLGDKDKGKEDKKTASPKAVLDLLKEARTLSRARAVAAYFGALSKGTDASLETRKAAHDRHQKMEGHRKDLAHVALLEARISLHAGNTKAAKRALREVRRWEEEPSEDYQQVEFDLLKRQKLFGLALRKLEVRLKKSPFDKKLLEEKIALFKKLKFNQRFIERIRLDQKIRQYHQSIRN